MKPDRISGISRLIAQPSVLFKDARRQKIVEELKVIFKKRNAITLAELLIKYNVRFIWQIASRLVYYEPETYELWSLLALMAEAAKPDILKMAGIADERAGEINASVARLQTSLESKRPQPVQALSGSRPARKPDTFEKSSSQKK